MFCQRYYQQVIFSPDLEVQHDRVKRFFLTTVSCDLIIRPHEILNLVRAFVNKIFPFVSEYFKTSDQIFQSFVDSKIFFSKKITI